MRFIDDLKAIKASGRNLNMLVNSICDGVMRFTKTSDDQLLRDFETLSRYGCAPDSATVTSFRTMRMLRKLMPCLKLRVSVINEVRSEMAMSYFGDFADGFYVDQSLNRDMAALRRIKTWCDANGKKLYILANSSCMPDCPFRFEHYSAISHIKGIERALVSEGGNPAVLCRETVQCEFCQVGDPYERALAGTWIPPRSVGEYDGVCNMMKLSTRLHPDPRMVLDAYCAGRDCDIIGILGEKLESVRGASLVQSRLPDEMFSRFLTCGSRCTGCGYCAALAKTLGGK